MSRSLADMDAFGDEQRATRYLVELTRPDAGWEDIQAMTASLRSAAEELGGSVRFLRSVFVPEDGSCLLIYEAPSAAAAEEAASRAQLAVERVHEALALSVSSD
jgi:uncharacterized protein DUF4242